MSDFSPRNGRVRAGTRKLDAHIHLRSNRVSGGYGGANLASGSLRDDTQKLTARQIAFRDCRCREGSADSNKFGRRPSQHRHPIGFCRVVRHENHTNQHEKKLRASRHERPHSNIRWPSGHSEGAATGGASRNFTKMQHGSGARQSSNKGIGDWGFGSGDWGSQRVPKMAVR